MDKVKSQVLKMKGKTFTITLSNGQKLRGKIVGIKKDQVMFKATRGSSQTQQFGGSFFFFFPLPFFFGLFDGVF